MFCFRGSHTKVCIMKGQTSTKKNIFSSKSFPTPPALSICPSPYGVMEEASEQELFCSYPIRRNSTVAPVAMLVLFSLLWCRMRRRIQKQYPHGGFLTRWALQISNLVIEECEAVYQRHMFCLWTRKTTQTACLVSLSGRQILSARSACWVRFTIR